MEDKGSDLQFDRASYAAGTSKGVPCTRCKGPLGDSYWKWQQAIVCARCRDGLAAALADSQSGKRLAKAVLQGGATALGCGVAYAILTAMMKGAMFALATIGIAFVIARVVRKASGGVGGTRFQIAAVVLTYFAATMGYIPGIWLGLMHASEHAESQDKTETQHPAESPATAEAPKTERSHVSAGSFLVAVAFLIGIMLASPFLELTTAPFGLLVVGFGLWEAWKLSRGPPLVIEGPFRVGVPAVAKQTAP